MYFIYATCHKVQNVQDYFVKIKITKIELLDNKPDIKSIKKTSGIT